MVNMLIAIMAKTFDSVWDESFEIFLYLKGRQVATWSEYPAVPPPLNLLQAPYYLVYKPGVFLSKFLRKYFDREFRGVMAQPTPHHDPKPYRLPLSVEREWAQR